MCSHLEKQISNFGELWGFVQQFSYQYHCLWRKTIACGSVSSSMFYLVSVEPLFVEVYLSLVPRIYNHSVSVTQIRVRFWMTKFGFFSRPDTKLSVPKWNQCWTLNSLHTQTSHWQTTKYMHLPISRKMSHKHPEHSSRAACLLCPALAYLIRR